MPKRARDKHSIFLQLRANMILLDGFQQSVQNYKDCYFKVVPVGGRRPFYRDYNGDLRSPLHWTRSAINVK